MTVEIIPARQSLGLLVADNMRAADRREVWVSDRLTPREAVRLSIEVSTESWIALRDGVPVIAFGVAEAAMVPFTGSPWMLATDDIIKMKTTFLRQSRAYIEHMLYRFNYLENYVHDGNTYSKAWLKWSGFVIEESEPMGPDRELFCRFWKQKEV